MQKPTLLAQLFKQALDENRPSFIDFLLRINYDPRLTSSLERIQSSASSQRNAVVRTTTEAFDLPSQSKSREAITTYQNQVELGEKGLSFVLQLYKEALGLIYTVSSDLSKISHSILAPV